MRSATLLSRPSGSPWTAPRISAGSSGVKRSLPAASTPVETVTSTARARSVPPGASSAGVPRQSTAETGAFSRTGSPSASRVSSAPSPSATCQFSPGRSIAT